MSHRHSITSLVVVIVEFVEDSSQFLLEGFTVRGIFKVEMSSKQFIRTLASQYHFYMLGCQAIQEEIWDGSSDKLRFIGLHVVNYSFKILESLISSELTLMMYSS